MRAKTLGTKIPPVSARKPLFRGPRLPPEEVSARLNFSARGPKNLLLHGKNQAGRVPYYWPAMGRKLAGLQLSGNVIPS